MTCGAGAVGHRGCPHQPQQGIGAGPPLKAGREPGACLATEGDAEASRYWASRSVRRAQGAATAGRRSVKIWRGHVGMVTEKLAHPQLQAHGVGAPRQIGEGACIPAVDPRGLHVAERAGDTGVGRDHVECDLRQPHHRCATPPGPASSYPVRSGQGEQEQVWKRKRVPPHARYRPATQMPCRAGLRCGRLHKV